MHARLNKDLWHPLPDRAEEDLVKRLMAESKVAIDFANDSWEEEVDTDDDCFV